LQFQEDDKIFLGKDARIFHNLTHQKLPQIYEYIFEEGKKGFGKVIVKNRDYEKTKKTMKFLNLSVMIEKEKGDIGQ
jgi:hypothetical protein